VIHLDHIYNICVIDIGSPKLGNLGWCYTDGQSGQHVTGDQLDDVIPLIADGLLSRGLILGLEAPLFVPLRADLMLATKARQGEGRRPWSAGAGAQVLAMNLPIMSYLFSTLKKHTPMAEICVNDKSFEANPGQIMLFEALVSGADKGTSHMDDARIMGEYCLQFSKDRSLPPTILEDEADTEFFNLAAAAMLRCGWSDDIALLNQHSPIYKPSHALP